MKGIFVIDQLIAPCWEHVVMDIMLVNGEWRKPLAVHIINET